eukprot:9521798-Heterocapsa_arctica.AAC.1
MASRSHFVPAAESTWRCSLMVRPDRPQHAAGHADIRDVAPRVLLLEEVLHLLQIQQVLVHRLNGSPPRLLEAAKRDVS